MHTILMCSNTQLTNSRFYNQQKQQDLLMVLQNLLLSIPLNKHEATHETAKCASNSKHNIFSILVAPIWIK